MELLKVSVKWGKEKYDLEVNVKESPLVLKKQLYEKTGVLPERQKVMVKGTNIKDDTNWSSLNLKDGAVLMMLGSAEKDIPQKPMEKTVFLEDLSDDQAIAIRQSQFPAGLINLGNTCYMNATLQSLNAIPELRTALRKFKAPPMSDQQSNFVQSFKRLLDLLQQKTSYPVNPFEFVNQLRTLFPQFDQRGEGGVHVQQDAEECLSTILSTLNQKIPKLATPEEAEKIMNVNNDNSIIKQLFGIQVESKFENQETKDEPVTTKTETLLKLSCHISSNTNFLMDGLKHGLEEEIEKNSSTLNRTAVYKKTSRLTQLPYYMIVQFVRFYWKNDKKLKAKIVRPVEFPFNLDVYEFCTEELQKQLLPERKKLQELLDQEQQKAAKRPKIEGGKEEEIKEVEMKDSKEVKELDPSELVNTTGMYELFAIVSHKGRSADSGHYIGYAKEEDDKWLRYDDDKVDYINNEEVKKMSGKGGSDASISYILMYRSRKV